MKVNLEGIKMDVLSRMKETQRLNEYHKLVDEVYKNIGYVKFNDELLDHQVMEILNKLPIEDGEPIAFAMKVLITQRDQYNQMNRDLIFKYVGNPRSNRMGKR